VETETDCSAPRTISAAVSAGVGSENENAGRDRLEAHPDQRQRVIEPEQLDEQRRPAEQLRVAERDQSIARARLRRAAMPKKNASAATAPIAIAAKRDRR
jgi:hypothetical protein